MAAFLRSSQPSLPRRVMAGRSGRGGTVRGKEAAWPGSKGDKRDAAGVPPAARDVLDRIVRLGCRTLGADEIVVLVRDGRDTHTLLPVARSCTDGDGRRAPTGPALDRAMSTGAPAAGD